MDMNFMSVLGHSLEQKSKMSTQLILEYIFDYKQDSYSNYQMVMKAFVRILERKCGSMLIPFLRY